MYKDKAIVITGGSSGAGKALAQRFIKRGASLALIARDEGKLKTVRDELLKSRPGEERVEIFSCNVADFSEVEKTFAAIVSKMGIPDILINSAGILKEGYFEKIPLQVFREVMDINYFGTLNCIRAALPYFKEKGRGRVVNLCSMGGLIGSFGYAAYCSSKFAVTGLTETLRGELKPQNIIFHLVCPGEFESPMVDELNTYRTEENRTLVQTVPVLGVDQVADEIISGIEKNKYRIIPGRTARFLELFNRWFPVFGRMIVDSRIKKVYRGPEKR